MAIGENKSLTAGTTTFPFGPITQSGNTFTENATIDDYVITPLSALTGTDTMTVTPIPVPGGSFQPQSTFTNLSCIPYADFSAAAGSAQGNPDPVCVEVERDCFSTGTDCSTIIYTATLDFNIDKFSEPNGVGGAAFLGQDGAACPTFGFNHNITSSYTGSSVTDPLKGGSKDGGSCYVAAFDPTAAVVPAGKTVSTFFGFELPVLDSAVSPKFDGFKNPILPLEPLSWDSNDSSGTGLKGLQVCTAPNPDGSCSAPAGVGAFWVNLSSIPVANCGTFQGENNLPGTLLNSNNFPGEELFVWNTTKAKGVPKGCQVRVVLQFSQGGFQAPALFQYLKAQ